MDLAPLFLLLLCVSSFSRCQLLPEDERAPRSRHHRLENLMQRFGKQEPEANSESEAHDHLDYDDNAFDDFEYWDDDDPEEPSDEPSSREDYDQEAENGTQADTTTTLKWTRWGTRNELSPRKNTVTFKRSEYNEAVKHAILISKEGICKTPQRRVIDIQSIHPHPSKTYIPHCTFLHRCGDDTGCCKSSSMSCVPKTTQTVELYFYITVVGIETKMVEKLSFINHTRCECAHRTVEYMLKEEMMPVKYESTTQRQIIIPKTVTNAPPVALKRCQCPSEFTVYMLDDGECECDCSNKQRVCMRIKRGKEYFGMKDRMCIQSGQCQTPSCEFGDYIHTAGRCPRKQESLDNPLSKQVSSSRSK